MKKLLQPRLREIKTYENNRHGDAYKEYLKRGLMSTSMLFGAVNILRKLNGRSPYASFYGMIASLKQAGGVPVKLGRMNWWNAEDAINRLVNFMFANSKKASLDHGLAATIEECQNGEWQDVGRCHAITGIPKIRIARFGNNHPEHVRVTPNGDRLYHLDTLREWSDYRQPKWISDRFGIETLNHLEKTRKTKKWYIPDAGDKKATLLYVPEFSHL